jgi:hypothetical protein
MFALTKSEIVVFTWPNAQFTKYMTAAGHIEISLTTLPGFYETGVTKYPKHNQN